jgi:hypothetical protein
VTTCKDVHSFLTQVNDRAVNTVLPPADASRLSELGLVRFVGSDQVREWQTDVSSLSQAQYDLAEKRKAQLAALELARRDEQKVHSVLFHLHGKDKQAEEIQQAARDTAAEQAMEQDLLRQQQAFNDLVGKRALYDSLSPYAGGYVGLTPLGSMQIRNLGVRLYRLADSDFETYWAQSQRIDQELNGLADHGADYFNRLAFLASVQTRAEDRSYLWAISIGLSKVQPDPSVGSPRFQDAYATVSRLSSNPENRLMASEILFAAPQSPADNLPALTPLLAEVGRAGVPSDAALGIAAILLFGRRADGTFATDNLVQFLRVTKSYESAALLSVMNEPTPDLVQKFGIIRSMFTSWGYEPSEDVELSSAYLTVSEIPVEGISTKLAIIARGMASYLQYPLVSAAILASVATLEANETLNVLEEAYGIVGRRATGMTQAELICLAVRMVDGIRNELVGTLDATATVPPTAAQPRVFYGRPMFLPIVVAHNTYFATYDGVSGVHPGHVHGIVGGGIGGGG